MKLRILTFIICIMAMCTTIAAAQYEASVICEDGSTYISGEISLGAVENPTAVTVTVFDSDGNLNFADIVMSDMEGMAKFRYNNLGASGDYVCYIYVPSLGKTDMILLADFIGLDYWTNFVDDIETASKAGDFETVKTEFLAETDKLSTDLTLYNTIVDKDSVFKIMVNNYTDVETPEDVVKEFLIACRLTAFNENNTASNLKNLYADELENKYFGILDVLPKGEAEGNSVLDELSEDLQNIIYDSIAIGKTYDSTKKLTDAFLDNVLIKTVESAENYGVLKKVLLAYENTGIIDLCENGYRDIDEVSKEMLESSYSSYKAVEEAYNTIANTPKRGNGGYSDGYSGRGSVGGSAIVIPQATVQAPTGDTIQNVLAPKYFDDMEDAKWATDAVDNLYEKKIINGTGERVFSPHLNVTRSEMSKMVVNTAGMSITGENVGFSDVDNSQWYYPYVATAYKNGIFIGYDDGSFGTFDEITRQEAAVVIHRLISSKAEALKTNGFIFADDLEIAPWAKEAVYYLKSLEIMNGRSNDEFRPLEKLTRVEAAVLLNAVCKYFETEGEV